MIGRILALILLALTLSGCATFPEITQARSACVNQPGGWCSFTRNAAEDSYIYAIAATNVYKDPDETFRFEGTSLEHVSREELPKDVGDTGFDYEVYERYSRPKGPKDEPFERIIAFRGTDASAADVVYGSLRPNQREHAIEYFKKELARFPKTKRWILTGHSLGGALATEVSIRVADFNLEEGVTLHAYAFNVSPFYAYESGDFYPNRTIINTRGEVLRSLRKFRPSPAADMYVINCNPEAGSFSKHSIARLASCLTWIAAYHTAEAGTFIDLNAQGPLATRINKPGVECGEIDKPHPGVIPEEVRDQQETCLHRERRFVKIDQAESEQ